ncbi:MAG TPA: hypothetical protein VE870_00800 [Bacteroidales bacterium]|nr:hypothetical protein [Bacteroidales bacterium]
MMTRRFIALALMVSFVGFISCKKDNNNDTVKVPVQESKDNLNSLAADMQKDMNAVYEENGWMAANTFVSLMSIEDPVFNGNIVKKSTGKKLTLKSFMHLENLKRSGDHVVFADYVGTYTWNAANQGWDISQNAPSDKIVFNFPLESAQSVNNNVSLTVYDYQEVEITETDEYGTWTYWEPSAAHADLVVNDTKYLELNYTAAWNASSGDPQNVSVSLFVKPYTLSLSMSQESNTGSAEFILEEGDVRICSVGGDVTLNAETFDVQTITGYVQYRDIKLAGDLNVAAIDALETDPTADFLNTNVDLAFYNYPEDSKFADINFNDNGPDGLGIDIAFTDGTTIDGYQFVNDLMATLDSYVQPASAK